jgi:hypothetical protein
MHVLHRGLGDEGLGFGLGTWGGGNDRITFGAGAVLIFFNDGRLSDEMTKSQTEMEGGRRQGWTGQPEGFLFGDTADHRTNYREIGWLSTPHD